MCTKTLTTEKSKPCDIIEIFLSLHPQLHMMTAQVIYQVGIEVSVPTHASQKQRLACCCVSGSFGELIPNPNANKKRCIQKDLVGNVLHAVGLGKCMVAFDNGETIECCSNHLRVKARISAIPPDDPSKQAVERPTNAPPQPLAAVEQEIAELIKDNEDSHEDEEHIPPP